MGERQRGGKKDVEMGQTDGVRDMSGECFYLLFSFFIHSLRWAAR